MQKGKLHGAPLDNPQKILDIGTGTGIWAIEMADSYPSAVVTGNDLSPIQPRWVPPNIKFEVDDVESEWTHPPNQFDLVYIRYMVGSIGDWPRLIKQAFTAIKPGGYIEILDPDCRIRCDDGSLPKDSALRKWAELFVSGADKGGRSVKDAPKYKEHIIDAGFAEVTEEIFKLPNAPWPKDKQLKEAGAYHLATFFEGLEALSMRLFTYFHEMTTEQVQVLLVDVRKEMKDHHIHTYFNLHRIYARKPE
ncbi:hypothetical protein ABW20_dc0101740 [Dactylellina cionopaga]|nr:hypothetical protein ABW20_dc0101740 [Dactylellina cionopaga]